MAVVTTKEFVAAVARKRNGHARARTVAQQQCGDLRRIGEGLVVDFDQSRQYIECFATSHNALGVIGA